MYTILKFERTYFILVILLLVIEVLIAVFVHDRIVRPYIGDLLVVILIYCFLKSFLHVPPLKVAVVVLLFAYLVELLQYFHIVDQLGLGNATFARVIVGTSFEWVDLVAYTAGIVLILFMERFIAGKQLT